MSEPYVFDFFKTLFPQVFGRDDIILHPDLSASDVAGWDSFRQVEIVLALEENYGIRIRTRELDDITNLGELVALVRLKVAAKDSL